MPEVIVTYFHVRVPAYLGDVQSAMRHADPTVRIAGGYITSVGGTYLQASDGTFEIRALAPSLTNKVRSMITDHEGLIIDIETQHAPGIANLLTEIPE